MNKDCLTYVIFVTHLAYLIIEEELVVFVFVHIKSSRKGGHFIAASPMCEMQHKQNKTQYFRLRLSYELWSEKAESAEREQLEDRSEP